MSNDFIINLIGNGVLLIALLTIYDLMHVRLRKAIRPWITGVLIGLVGSIVIWTAVVQQEGIVFDTRSVLLSISALFLGTIPSLVAGLICALTRIYMGGEGIAPGLTVITGSVAIGLCWRAFRNPEVREPGLGELYLFGLIVHLFMLAAMFTLPWDTALDVVRTISIPVIAIFPLVTMVLGTLMVRKLRFQNSLSALRQSEERYHSLFSTSLVPILIIDGETEMIMDANPAAEKFYGWTLEKLRSKSIGQINTQQADELRADLYRALTESRNVFRFRHRIADGSVKEVEVAASPVTIGGRKCLCSFVNDQTERIAAEKAKEDFLANMSHEVRTPLNGFSGVLDILKDTPLNPDQLDLLNTARECCDDLIDLLNNILDYSRLRASSVKVNHQRFNIRTILARLERRFRTQAMRKGLEFKMECPSEVPTEIVGDPVRFQQVLENLLLNAVKFTVNGMIGLRVSVSEGPPAEPKLRIEIYDTGIGIPEEHKSQVYLPFFQGDTGWTRRHMGAGLGLSITLNLVELLGGRMDFFSVSGQGSTFWVEFPLSPPKGDTHVYRHGRIPTSDDLPITTCRLFEGQPVLLVEDSPVNLKIGVTLLVKLGLKVDTAKNGHEALEACRKHQYKLVFMDIQMPEMDGFEATRRIRSGEVPGGESLPIVALTAIAAEDHLEEMNEVGMNGSLVKPISLTTLREIILRYIPLPDQD